MNAVTTTPANTSSSTLAAQPGRADRLQGQADERTTSGDGDMMARIHEVTGVSVEAQQARTVLYQGLRNR